MSKRQISRKEGGTRDTNKKRRNIDSGREKRIEQTERYKEREITE